MRNLLKNNPENQQVVASMSLSRVANRDQLMEEFGVSAEVRPDGKIVIKPRDATQK